MWFKFCMRKYDSRQCLPEICTIMDNSLAFHCPSSHAVLLMTWLLKVNDVWNMSVKEWVKFKWMKVLKGLLQQIWCLSTVATAVAIPQLGPFISLVGAVCLSTLGLMFPAIIELVTFWDSPGLGSCYWRLWKNLFIILFGILGFITGTITSIEEIISEFGGTEWTTSV